MSIFDDADLSPMGIYELDIVEPNELGMAELLGGIQCRLLIVDGDDDHRSHLQRRLQMDGCVVDDAPDIDTAKQMLHAQTYDLILLDLLMQRKIRP
jgi:two-component system cell cycle response regulator